MTKKEITVQTPPIIATTKIASLSAVDVVAVSNLALLAEAGAIVTAAGSISAWQVLRQFCNIQLSGVARLQYSVKSPQSAWSGSSLLWLQIIGQFNSIQASFTLQNCAAKPAQSSLSGVILHVVSGPVAGSPALILPPGGHAVQTLDTTF